MIAARGEVDEFTIVYLYICPIYPPGIWVWQATLNHWMLPSILCFYHVFSCWYWKTVENSWKLEVSSCDSAARFEPHVSPDGWGSKVSCMAIHRSSSAPKSIAWLEWRPSEHPNVDECWQHDIVKEIPGCLGTLGPWDLVQWDIAINNKHNSLLYLACFSEKRVSNGFVWKEGTPIFDVHNISIYFIIMFPNLSQFKLN